MDIVRAVCWDTKEECIPLDFRKKVKQMGMVRFLRGCLLYTSETEFDGHGGVGQGCIVDGKNGEWYGLIFQDRGGVGRVPCLMPCTWTEDGWPMLGDKDGHIPNDKMCIRDRY